MAATPATVLLIVKDEAVRKALGHDLEAHGYQVRDTPPEAARHIDWKPSFAYVVATLDSDDTHSLIDELHHRHPAVQFLALVASGQRQLDADALGVDHLTTPATAVNIATALQAMSTRNRSLARGVYDLMQDALRRTGGNKTRAAALLEIHRTVFQRMLKKDPPAR